MSESTRTDRIVGDLVDGDLAPEEATVVEALLRTLTEDLDRPAPPPAPAFLEQLVAAVPPQRHRTRRGLRIVVTSGVLVLGAAGSAAAVSGSLPGSIQAVVHDVADTVGIDVPDAEPQGPPTSGGSEDGEGHGRSDEAPGRPEDPGLPEEPGRSDEAPGQPEDPPGEGVGPEGVPPGQDEGSPAAADPNGGNGNPDPGGGSTGGDSGTTPTTPGPATPTTPTTRATPTTGGGGAPNNGQRGAADDSG